MADDFAHGTLTLARLFAAQGHYENAIRIYRQLLDREPGRTDIAQALAEAQARQAADGRGAASDLGDLFAQWIDLLLRYDRLRRLERLSSARYSGLPPSGGPPAGS